MHPKDRRKRGKNVYIYIYVTSLLDLSHTHTHTGLPGMNMHACMSTETELYKQEF